MNELGSFKAVSQAPTFVKVYQNESGLRGGNTKEYCRADDIIGVQQDNLGKWHVTVKEVQIEGENGTGVVKYPTFKISDEVAQKLNLIG